MKKEEVKSGSNVYKILEKAGPGMIAAAQELAVNSNAEPEFKTPKALLEYLKSKYAELIKQVDTKAKGKDEEFEKKLTVIEGEKIAPKGWGHTFSNGKHGPDMAKDNGKLAIARATKEKKSIGVWVNKEKAERLLCRIYSSLGGKPTEKYIKFSFPENVGLEYNENGKYSKCEGLFIKINDDGVIVTAYPTNQD